MRFALALPVILIAACADAPPEVPAAPAPTIPVDAEISGDFGVYSHVEGMADIDVSPSTLKVQRTTPEGYVLAIVVPNATLPLLAAGQYDNALNVVRLCSGPRPGVFAYDRVADDSTLTVTETPEGKRYEIETIALAGEDVDETTTSFSLLRE